MIGRSRLHPALAALALLSLASVLASCTSGEAGSSSNSTGESTGASAQALPETPELLAPTSTPQTLSEFSHPISRVSPSLEEQIFASDVIVRASLDSATSSIETVPGNPGIAPTYRALHLLRFAVHEYLKGNGPSEIVVMVRGRHTHLTQSEARVFADLKLQQRNTTWDNRQGVLFLNSSTMPIQAGNAERSSAPSPSETAFEFTLSNYGVETEWDYSIDTLSRAWLPAAEAGLPDGVSPDPSMAQFTTDGTASPSTLVSLAELRSGISEIEDTLEAGAGIAGFARCVQDKIRHQRHRRAVPYTPYQHSRAILSGLAAGTEIHRVGPFVEDPTLSRFWFTGTDSQFFHTFVEEVDSNPRYGYDRVIAVLRPLPAGSYEYEYRVQRARDTPCDFVPEPYLEGTVSVTAPAGTVHEAFFDPGAWGSSVGFTSNAGVLEPAEFSADGVPTTIQTLAWESGVVAMELSPAMSLAGRSVDFIALDGSVALSLSTDDAQTQGEGEVLSWNVPRQPWQAGDRLMIRIKDAAR